MNTADQYREKQKAHLEAKVRGQNLVNQLANAYEQQLREYFRQFIGKPVLINGGSIAKRVREKMPAKPTASNFRMWNGGGTYSLSFECDVCLNYTDFGCTYRKAYIRVGDVKDHVLTSIYDTPSDRRTDWTVEEVHALRADLREKRDAFHNANHALSLAGFEEYDQ